MAIQALVSSASTSIHTQSTVRSHPLKMIALGDSLVYGYGDPDGGGWVERLRRQWMSVEHHGPVLYNLGIRGNRVIQVLERLEHEFQHRGELRNQVPDHIILSVGVNDSARIQSHQGRSYTDLEQFQHQINTLLNTAQQLCPVLFVGMVPVDETRMPFHGCLYYNHQSQSQYKEVTRIACREHQIPYLDLFQLWLNRGDQWWRSRLCSDGLHPNTLGYQSLLQDVLNWEAMRKIAPPLTR